MLTKSLNPDKHYLGDGIYVLFDGQDNIELTTEDGINVTNRIFLEVGIIVNLFEYCKRNLIL